MINNNKIAFFCHPYHRGGVTRWMADAATAFADAGKEVYFITVEPIKEFFSAKGRETLLELLEKQHSKAHIVSTQVGYEFEFGTPEYRAFIYKKLLAQLPACTPVIVSDDAVVWAAATALYATYPVIGVLHSDEDTYYNLAIQYQQQASFFACVSGRVHNALKIKIPVYDQAHIATIPCGIDITAFGPASGNGPLKLVYAGRLTAYQKRAGDLALICRELAKTEIHFHLHIVGDGDLKDTIEQEIIVDGLGQQVTFHGWLPRQEVATLLGKCDILLLTSDSEGMPIAMMEALASGCGVVGTRVSGIEDQEHQTLAMQCFRVYTTGDIPDAIHKIKEIEAIPKAARQQAARQLAETEFSMEKCMARYKQAIATINFTPSPLPKVRLTVAEGIHSRAIAFARSVKVRLLHS